MATSNASLRSVVVGRPAEQLEARKSTDLRLGCSGCSIRAMCFRPQNTSVVCLPGLKAARPGQYLVRAGDRCEQFYLPRSGAIKAYRNTPDGREQVMDFYLPGELAGMDGLADGYSQWNLVALEASSLCTLGREQMLKTAGEVPELMSSVMRQLSGDMLHAADLATGSAADARLAGFLIELARRCGDKCLAGSDFHLPMSRQDIASYLALAPETISRLFARLRDDGLIEVDRKRLRIMNFPKLSRTAEAV